MALQITRTKGDKTANYFRVVKLWFNLHEKDMEMELVGYTNKADADLAESTGASTAQFSYKFTLSGTDFPDITKANWLSKAEKDFIKNSTLYGEWSTATDTL